MSSCQPLYGKLSDIFGRKPCLLVAYSVFALGSLGCGLAQSMGQFIAARVSAFFFLKKKKKKKKFNFKINKKKIFKKLKKRNPFSGYV